MSLKKIELNKLLEFKEKFYNQWKIFIQQETGLESMLIFFYPNAKYSKEQKYKIVSERCNKFAEIIETIEPDSFLKNVLKLNNNKLILEYLTKLYTKLLKTKKIETLTYEYNQILVEFKIEFGTNSLTPSEEFNKFLRLVSVSLTKYISYINENLY